MAARFSDAAKHISEVLNWEVVHHPLKTPDIALWIVVHLGVQSVPHVTHKQLYAELPCAMPTAVRCLKRLMALGWIETMVLQQDKRVKCVRLTNAAESFLIAYASRMRAPGRGEARGRRLGNGKLPRGEAP